MSTYICYFIVYQESEAISNNQIIQLTLPHPIQEVCNKINAHIRNKFGRTNFRTKQKKTAFYKNYNKWHH